MKLGFEIYYFDENTFGFEVTFPKDKSFVVLDGSASENDVALLIGSLLALNELNLDGKFIDALHKEDELALVGGLSFEKENTIIGPSCCADLQDWKEIVEGVHSKKTSWMGHDPDPWFEFSDNDITLWSDEADSKNLSCIKFSQSEFEKMAIELDLELSQCLSLIEVWINKNYEDAPIELYNGIKDYLRC